MQGAATSIAAVVGPSSAGAGGDSALLIRGGAYLVPYSVPAWASAEPWATLAESMGPFAGAREAQVRMRPVAAYL